MSAVARNPRAGRWVTAIFAAVILIPSLYGFGSKFVEFIAIYRGEVDGAAANGPDGDQGQVPCNAAPLALPNALPCQQTKRSAQDVPRECPPVMYVHGC